MRRIFPLLIILGLAGCGGAASPTAAPTLGPILSAGSTARPTPDPGFAVATVAPASQGAASLTPAPTVSGGSGEQQYRRWMEEARATHPYSDTVDVMWQVMICESSGNPAAVGPGGLQGLFQYQPSTWAEAWNPYRTEPINDPRAQIFATAKAWSDGYQRWWGVCLP